MIWYDYDNAPDPADLVDQNGPPDEDDYERASCPVCGDPDCTFPPECRDAVGVWPEPVWGSNE